MLRRYTQEEIDISNFLTRRHRCYALASCKAQGFPIWQQVYYDPLKKQYRSMKTNEEVEIVSFYAQTETDMETKNP